MTLGAPVVPLYPFFPAQIDYRKVGTLLLASIGGPRTSVGVLEAASSTIVRWPQSAACAPLGGPRRNWWTSLAGPIYFSQPRSLGKKITKQTQASLPELWTLFKLFGKAILGVNNQFGRWSPLFGQPFSRTFRCAQCPPGYYQSNTYSTSCEPCSKARPWFSLLVASAQA